MVVPPLPHLRNRRCDARARARAGHEVVKCSRVERPTDSLVLGNVMGFTVSMLGHNSQRTSRSFGIDLTGAQVEEGLFSGAYLQNEYWLTV